MFSGVDPPEVVKEDDVGSDLAADDVGFADSFLFTMTVWQVFSIFKLKLCSFSKSLYFCNFLVRLYSK